MAQSISEKGEEMRDEKGRFVGKGGNFCVDCGKALWRNKRKGHFDNLIGVCDKCHRAIHKTLVSEF